MTTLNVGDAVSVWMGPSVGEKGKVERKDGGWIYLRTLEGKEVRTHTATVEPNVESFEGSKVYIGTFY